VGPHARTVADLALFDSVVTGNFEAFTAKPLKGVKLGVVRDYWFAGLDPEVERITSGALEKLEDAGVVLVESTMADLAWLIQRITGIVQIHDLLQELPKYLSDFATGVSFQQVVEQASPDVKACFAEFVSEAVYAEARDIHLPKLRRNFRDYFRRTGVDAIVFPATMVPAPLIGNDVDVPIGSKKISFVTAIARNIAPGSTAGLPGLVLPSGLTKSGLPVSLELDAPSGEDRNLLALGLSVEAVMACAIRPKEPPRPL
jgi:mandelamide amidase